MQFPIALSYNSHSWTNKKFKKSKIRKILKRNSWVTLHGNECINSPPPTDFRFCLALHFLRGFRVCVWQFSKTENKKKTKKGHQIYFYCNLHIWWHAMELVVPRRVQSHDWVFDVWGNFSQHFALVFVLHPCSCSLRERFFSSSTILASTGTRNLVNLIQLIWRFKIIHRLENCRTQKAEKHSTKKRRSLNLIVSITMGKILMCSTDGANSCTGNLSGKSSEERRGDKKVKRVSKLK